MNERIKHVGIMGGTFDPIHCGHLLAAEQAREQAGLDEVWFMPTHIPPHKTRVSLTSATTRLQMVELAVADHESFRVIDVELRREGPSYTYDTIVQLVEQFPDCRFSFIIGGDMVEILPKWYRFEELSRMIRFIGLARPGSEVDRVSNENVTFVEMPVWDISSTLIRTKAAAGQSIRYLVPRSVERYIKENRFYE
ncbi:nicotinic acid mononucleotide adenylyltransferase [Brevibacillus choshinensis]|uniref:Probable nicotinate-nucleotide adenylyltransferase n=1 Tax=Brevibacillus choshinensis TaxID=54911 RepID=A0ABR5NBJ4_BRECH|nr:nicotinate-nucleotide adenylyltransferase [Brevibacillus choshinensis]KQL48921.1 nicotinic acid mononucleotide adenylyltransferase [Brevibacillus choshinensis]